MEEAEENVEEEEKKVKEKRRKRRTLTPHSEMIQQPNCFSESAQQLLFGLTDPRPSQPSLPGL